MLGAAGYSDLPCVSNVQTSNVLKINVKMVDRLVSTCLSEIHRGASKSFLPKDPPHSPVVIARCNTEFELIAPS